VGLRSPSGEVSRTSASRSDGHDRLN